MNATESFNRKVARMVHAVDEVAFRTGLLALNAAVEAAQANRRVPAPHEPAAGTREPIARFLEPAGDADSCSGLAALGKSLREASAPTLRVPDAASRA